MFATFRRKDNNLLGTAVLTAESLLGPFKPYSDGPVTPQNWSSLDGPDQDNTSPTARICTGPEAVAAAR
ncbi:hypothetical protein [Paenibacillus humicola]|uniref:hypothetical protein n=1 Tax=Paenibacillus humicola TaxID=3110540 RepID=UPI00237AC200|nr:hypothetical protein [Paenibacillus humicola]